MTKQAKNAPTADINVRGLSVFFYALVPWALSVGAVGWFAFSAGIHDAEQRARAERRMATAVGETSTPTAQYKLTFTQSKLFIERARYDGQSLELYYRNKSTTRPYNYCLQWTQRAADGTILGVDERCFPGDERPLLPGERSELLANFDAGSWTNPVVPWSPEGRRRVQEALER